MLANIYYLLIAGLFIWYFIYLRKVSEFGRLHAKKYCEQEGLQFLSIARRSSRPSFNKAYGLHWYSIFDFEFSGDGQSKYQGVIALRGYRLENVDVPAYRIN